MDAISHFIKENAKAFRSMNAKQRKHFIDYAVGIDNEPHPSIIHLLPKRNYRVLEMDLGDNYNMYVKEILDDADLYQSIEVYPPNDKKPIISIEEYRGCLTQLVRTVDKMVYFYKESIHSHFEDKVELTLDYENAICTAIQRGDDTYSNISVSATEADDPCFILPLFHGTEKELTALLNGMAAAYESHFETWTDPVDR
jgi:hypothetical protein